MFSRSWPNSMTERIARVQDEFTLCTYKCRSLEARMHFSFAYLNASLKNAADDAFLSPHLPFAQLAIRVQACKLRACSRTARRAVVGFSRTQDKILAVHACDF